MQKLNIKQEPSISLKSLNAENNVVKHYTKGICALNTAKKYKHSYQYEDGVDDNLAEVVRTRDIFKQISLKEQLTFFSTKCLQLVLSLVIF